MIQTIVNIHKTMPYNINNQKYDTICTANNHCIELYLMRINDKNVSYVNLYLNTILTVNEWVINKTEHSSALLIK